MTASRGIKLRQTYFVCSMYKIFVIKKKKKKYNLYFTYVLCMNIDPHILKVWLCNAVIVCDYMAEQCWERICLYSVWHLHGLTEK